MKKEGEKEKDFVSISKCKNCVHFTKPDHCKYQKDPVKPSYHCSLFNLDEDKYKDNQIELVKDNKKTSKKEKKEIKSLQQLRNEGIPEIKWLVDKIIPEAGVTILAGAPGCFKSWFAMNLAVDLSCNNDFLDYFETRKDLTILYLDEENGTITLPRRFEMLITGKGMGEMVFNNLYCSIFNNFKFDTPEGISELLTIIQGIKPDLVVVDSLVRCMEGEEDRATDVRRIFEGIKILRDENPRMSFVMLHHTTKMNGNKVDMNGLRGSGDLAAQCDTIFMFSQNSLGNQVYINMVKNRHIDKQEISDITLSVESFQNDWIQFKYDPDLNGKTEAVDLALKDYLVWVQEGSIVSWFTKDMQTALKSRGHSKDATFKLRRLLVDEGYVRKVAHGKYEVCVVPSVSQEVLE